MSLWLWAIPVSTALLLWALLARRLLENPRGEVLYGMLQLVGWAYARVFHAARYHGQENLPRSVPPEGLIVVANHTAGVDPFLIQVGWLTTEIRWVMTAEMRVEAFGPLWEWLEIIFVGNRPDPSSSTRRHSELASIKEMIRHVKSGGILGIFPEGRIARPRGTLATFQPGVGTIVSKSGAKVLPIFIEGTPETQSAWSSLYFPGRCRVRYFPLYDPSGKKPDQIVADLQSLYESLLNVKAAPQHD